MDPLFVGGSFENFNWLAEFVVQIPFFVACCIFNRRTIGPMKITEQIPIFGTICILNRRTIDPMLFAIQPPKFAAIFPFNRRAIDPMMVAVQTPMFVAVGRNIANWLLVTHRSE